MAEKLLCKTAKKQPKWQKPPKDQILSQMEKQNSWNEGDTYRLEEWAGIAPGPAPVSTGVRAFLTAVSHSLAKIYYIKQPKTAQMAKTTQITIFCHKWQKKTREMRVIRTDERNEQALRPAQRQQARGSGPF
jgi:hypothetical protein